VPEAKPLKTSEPKKGDKAEYEEVILSEMLDGSPGVRYIGREMSLASSVLLQCLTSSRPFWCLDGTTLLDWSLPSKRFKKQ
jgi:hypothetical protein